MAFRKPRGPFKYVPACTWGWGQGRKKGQMWDCRAVLSSQAFDFFTLTEKLHSYRVSPGHSLTLLISRVTDLFT